MQKQELRLQLGRVVITPGAIERAQSAGLNVAALMARHRRGDWGDCGAEDARANDQALKNGARILSVYGEGERKLWVITDAATDACPACIAGLGTCEKEKGEWQDGIHFRTDLPLRRVSTTILRPEDY